MTKQDFIDYLIAHECEIVRIANQGYHVMRNKINKKMSGVPFTDPPLPATVCRICKTLDVPTPDAAHSAQAIIDAAHSEFNKE